MGSLKQMARGSTMRCDVSTAITTDADTHDRVIGGAAAKAFSGGETAEAARRSREVGFLLA